LANLTFLLTHRTVHRVVRDVDKMAKMAPT